MSLIVVHELSAPHVPLPSRQARCADGNGTLTHLFFSDQDLDVARAKAICRTCDLAAECLSGALDRAESSGVWGGTLLVDGEPTRLPSRRGRPPAGPRVEHVDDAVIVPDHLVA